MSITIGLWVLPLLVTILAFFRASLARDEGGYVGGVFEVIIAVFLSMFSWLIYFATAYFIGGG